MSVQFPDPIGAQSLLDEAEVEYDWLIPGVLEKSDRLIVTGGEGKGKSTLLRQMSVQVSLGIHPFTLEDIGARSVLFIDLENSRNQIRREFRKISGGRWLSNEMLKIASWPSGLDLLESYQQQAFTKVLQDTLPDFVVMGPMYKMAPHLDKEEQSGELAAFLDAQRAQFNFALLMESHQPHMTIADGKRYRPERPFGSSIWLRWPEFGVCVEDDGTLRHWRGARDVDRQWPLKLIRNGIEWPWEVAPLLCLNCNNPLTETQEKYCSEKCSNAGRQKDFRARKRML